MPFYIAFASSQQSSRALGLESFSDMAEAETYFNQRLARVQDESPEIEWELEMEELKLGAVVDLLNIGLATVALHTTLAQHNHLKG